MTESTVVFTSEADSAAAGKEIGERLRSGLSGHAPDAVMLFASSRHDYEVLLKAIHESCRPGVLVGCSSAGEFVSHERAEGAVSAVGLRSNQMRFAAGLGRNLREDRLGATEQIASSFKGPQSHQFPHRAALVLVDALAGYRIPFPFFFTTFWASTPVPASNRPSRSPLIRARSIGCALWRPGSRCTWGSLSSRPSSSPR